VKQEAFDAVIAILRKYAFQKSIVEDATESSDMIVDLKINSARIVDIILDIEDEFGIEIPTKDLEKIKTIGDLVSIINARQ